MDREKEVIRGVRKFIRANYDRGLYFSTRGLVGDYLIKKGYKLRRVDRDFKRKVITSASQVVRKLLKDKKISKYSSSVYRVCQRSS